MVWAIALSIVLNIVLLLVLWDINSERKWKSEQINSFSSAVFCVTKYLNDLPEGSYRISLDVGDFRDGHLYVVNNKKTLTSYFLVTYDISLPPDFRLIAERVYPE